MIEKKIHYCWFGCAEKPKSVLKCIDSWKNFLPDYEIIEWNESNFDISCNQYCKEAYERRKWAFVSDFARLYVVYHHGGIYFDTDVEVIKSFDDLSDQEFFLGMEDSGRIATGLGFGAKKNSPVIKAMLDEYDGLHYIGEDGAENKIVCPVYNTRAIEQLGVKLGKEKISCMGGTIYPAEYFSPINLNTSVLKITKNTYSIHHFSNSWMTPSEKFKKKMSRPINVYVLRPTVRLIKKIFHIEGSIWDVWKSK